MAKIDFEDGKVVTLSKETEQRLRKELLKPTPPKDFEQGHFSIKAVSDSLVEIDTHTGLPMESFLATKVFRNLKELKKIRKQLDIFINYLEEIKE